MYKQTFDRCMEELKFSSHIETLTSSNIPYMVFVANEYDNAAYYLQYRDAILNSPKNHDDSCWSMDDDILGTREDEYDDFDYRKIIRKAEIVVPVGRYVTDEYTCRTTHLSIFDMLIGGECRVCMCSRPVESRDN